MTIANCGAKDAQGIKYDAQYLGECLATIRGRASPPIPPDDIVKALIISLALNPHKQLGIMSLRSGAQVPKTTEDLARRRLSVSDLDATSRELTQMVADRWGRMMIDALVVAEQLWPYYVRGLLAEAVGVSAEELKSKAESQVGAFSDRLSRGCTGTGLEAKTLKELLEIGEKNTRTGPSVRHQEEMGGGTPETMFKQPATSEQILELESRLGVSLPQDYTEFLATTNGFGGSDGSVFNGYYPDPEMFAADEVEWLSEDWIALPFEMLKIPRKIEDPYRKPSPEAWDTAMPLVDRVVHVGNRDIDDLWLIPPELVHKAKSAYLEMLEKGDAMEKKILQRAMEDFAGSMERFMKLEWCCIKNTCGSGPACHVFSNFRSYLESVVDNSGKDKMSRTRNSW